MLADTVGYAHPAQIKEVVRATREAIGDTLYGLHLHDTCGLGIANALAGLEVGIRAFDSCLAGLGGCPYAPGASGNIVTEDLVFMLESMGFTTGIEGVLVKRQHTPPSRPGARCSVVPNGFSHGPTQGPDGRRSRQASTIARGRGRLTPTRTSTEASRATLGT